MQAFSRLDTDDDDIITQLDLLRALGDTMSTADIGGMLEKIGCTNGKLFFADVLRLMQQGFKDSIRPPIRVCLA